MFHLFLFFLQTKTKDIRKNPDCLISLPFLFPIPFFAYIHTATHFKSHTPQPTKMEEKSDSKPTTFSEISMETLQSMPLHELVRLQRVIQQEISTRLNSNQPTTPRKGMKLLLSQWSSSLIASPLEEDIIETPKAEVPEESVKKGIFQNTSIITGKIKATVRGQQILSLPRPHDSSSPPRSGPSSRGSNTLTGMPLSLHSHP